MSFQIRGSLPTATVVQPITTADKFVLNAKHVEIPARINGDFTYSGNSRVEFDVNSPSDFINFLESYIRLDLTTDLSLEGANCSTRYLSEGGMHSLFREVRVETQGGVLIDRVQRYNKWYAMMSGIMHSKDFVDTHLQSAGDSVDIETYGNTSLWKEVSGTAFSFDFAGGAAAQLITGTGSDFLNDVHVGDMAIFVDKNLISYTTIVTSVLSATTITVDGLAGADVANLEDMYIVRKDTGVDPARKRIANTDNSSLTGQLLLPFLQMDSYFPLFLVRSGIRIILELERPEFVLCAPQAVVSAGYTAAAYTVSNPYYVAKFIKPSEALAQQYIQMFKQSGISYHMISYDHQMNVISSGQTGIQNLRIQGRGRSARHVLSFIQDLRAETVTAATANAGQSTFTADCIAQRIKANLSEWHVEVGSERYPHASPVDTTSSDNSELLSILEKCMGVYGLSLTSHRWKPEEWVEVAVGYKEFEQGTYGGRADSQRLVLAADFSRDPSPWSGMDVTLHSINLLPNFDATYALTDLDGSNSTNSALYFHTFIGKDSVVMLSEQNGLTLLI